MEKKKRSDSMAGRKDAYSTKIEPRFDEIKEWLKMGATEREVAKKLNIGYSTFNRYKANNRELRELLKKGREKPVEEIKAALLRKALGFQYEEKKVTTKKIVIEGEDGEAIPANVIQTEIYTKMALPDVAASMVLLKHWDKDSGWTNDPQSLELKKQELELRKEQVERESW